MAGGRPRQPDFYISYAIELIYFEIPDGNINRVSKEHVLEEALNQVFDAAERGDLEREDVRKTRQAVQDRMQELVAQMTWPEVRTSLRSTAFRNMLDRTFHPKVLSTIMMPESDEEGDHMDVEEEEDDEEET